MPHFLLATWLTALWSSMAFSLASLFFLPAIGLLFLLSSLRCFSDCDSSGSGVFPGSLTIPSSFWAGLLLGLWWNRIAALGKVCLWKMNNHMIFLLEYERTYVYLYYVCMHVMYYYYARCVCIRVKHMYVWDIMYKKTCLYMLTDMRTYISALLSSVAQ